MQRANAPNGAGGRHRISRRSLLRALGVGAAAIPTTGVVVAIHRAAGADAGASSLPNRLVVPALASDGAPPPVPLRDKIGRMVITGFRGLSIDGGSPISHDIVDRNISGVVLYASDAAGSGTRNISSPAQLHDLGIALRAFEPRPLFIAVDQEGGSVARLSPAHGFPATQSAADLGATGDPMVTYAAAARMAATMAAAGLNLNFAPDVDLNVNPSNPVIGALGRSFSADPSAVTAHAEAFIRAFHDHGILCTLKHFPGHGSSRSDSHLGFVNVTNTWSSVELEPFRNLVAAGFDDMIMTAHVFNANIDPNYPATLSHNTITGILRQQLGYNGVVITDDMGMAAITENYGFASAIERAILAGADILLYGNNLAGYSDTIAQEVIDQIETLVTNGVISASRIDESYARITALERRLVS